MPMNRWALTYPACIVVLVVALFVVVTVVLESPAAAIASICAGLGLAVLLR